MKHILTLDKINSKITHYTMLQSALSSKLSDLDETIQQSYKLDQIPKDTSKFSDEKLIKYIEERETLSKEVSNCKHNISKLESIKKNILISFSNLPECELKTMLKMQFFDGRKYSYIAKYFGYTECTVGYKLRSFMKYNLLFKEVKL